MEKDPFYYCIIGLARTVFAAQGLKFTVSGTENVPEDGGAVVAFNHPGYMDFTYGGIPFRAHKRYVRYMAKAEIWDNPIAGKLMRGMKHIPVDRIDGSESYRTAIEYLKMGRLVGVFPESTISRSFEVKNLRTGAVRMAQEANVPIIPVIMVGSQRVWTKGYPKKLGRSNTPIHIKVLPPWTPTGNPEEETHKLHQMMSDGVHEVWDEYAKDHGPLPEGAYWVPARLGGGAPTLEQAQKEDDEVAKERNRIRKLRDDLNELSSEIVEATRELMARSQEATREMVSRSQDATREMVHRSQDATREMVTRSQDATREMVHRSQEATRDIVNRSQEALNRTAEARRNKNAQANAEETTTEATAAVGATAATGTPQGKDSTPARDTEAVVASLKSTFDSLYSEVVDGTKEGANKIVEARDSLRHSYSELITTVQTRVTTMTEQAQEYEWPNVDQSLTNLLVQAKQVRDRLPARVKNRLPKNLEAVFTDVDGTIYKDGEISDRTKNALHAIAAKDIPVVLATGRPREFLSDVVEKLELKPIVICANGACIVDTATDEVLHIDGFLDGTPELLKDELEAQLPEAEVLIREVNGVAVKVVVKADMPGEEIADLIRDIAKDRAHLTWAQSYGVVELAPVGVNKSTGIQWLLQTRGIDPDNCIAFGDMPNDREMLHYVGTGITMGNAHRDLIREASWVTGTVGNDGVAEVLEHYLGDSEN